MMTDDRRPARDEDADDLAPETFNDEQHDHRSQAHEVAQDALDRMADKGSPTESTKHKSGLDLDDDSAQDLVDHMRDMEGSGRIDMGAYRGEPNMDDNEDEYGLGNKLDKDLPSGGS